MVSMKFLKEPTEEWHWLRTSTCCSVHTEAMLLPAKHEAWWGDYTHVISARIILMGLQAPHCPSCYFLSATLQSEAHPPNPPSFSLHPFTRLRPVSVLKTASAYSCSLSLLSFKGSSPRELLAFLIPSWHLLLIEPKLTYWISALRSDL